MKPIRLLALAGVLHAAADGVRAAVPALAAGEALTYGVQWTIISAGEIKISAENASVAGKPGLNVITTTETKGFVSALFEFQARGESHFEMPSGRLISTLDTSKSERKQTRSTVDFDYSKSSAKFTDEVEPAKSATIPMPKGEPLDLIMSLVQTRSWDLKPGESKDTLVIFDGEFYELTVHALAYEDVRTPLGRFRTLVLEPRMDKTPPKGMFKRGSTVKVWISQDERRLPVKFQVELKVGACTATLNKYEPAPKKP